MSLIQNLIPDPRFKTGKWTANDSTVTPIPAQDAVNVSNTSDSRDSFMQVILPDVSQYRGVNMTFACSLTAIDGSAVECFNGLLWIWVNGETAKVSDGGTAKVGRKNVQFTLPSDVTGLTLRWYAPGGRGTFQWRHPMLTRTVDYQWMLNGIGGGAVDGLFRRRPHATRLRRSMRGDAR